MGESENETITIGAQAPVIISFRIGLVEILAGNIIELNM